MEAAGGVDRRERRLRARVARHDEVASEPALAARTEPHDGMVVVAADVHDVARRTSRERTVPRFWTSARPPQWCRPSSFVLGGDPAAKTTARLVCVSTVRPAPHALALGERLLTHGANLHHASAETTAHVQRGQRPGGIHARLTARGACPFSRPVATALNREAFISWNRPAGWDVSKIHCEASYTRRR
jgi:hypothetical protein